MDQGRPHPNEGSPPAATEGWTASVDLARAARIDGRTFLARGEDPLAAILKAAAAVPIGGDLVVEAPFDPVPLRRVLGERGFRGAAQALAADHWRAFFRRVVADPAPGAVAPDLRCWREGDALHIDVRGLPPPEPMMTILRLIEGPDAIGTVVAHLDREPIYLYPELAERGWRFRVESGGCEVRLHLTRGGG